MTTTTDKRESYVFICMINRGLLVDLKCKDTLNK